MANEISSKPACCTPSAGAERMPHPAERVAFSKPGGVEMVAKNCDRSDLVRIEPGKFLMGTDREEAWPEDGEAPVREVEVDAYRIGRICVTNEAFEEFVEETGYITDAERFGWSYVFHSLLPNKVVKRLNPQTVQNLEWWYGVPGAYWKKPEGPGSNVKKRLDHPAIHVSWADAMAYCRWRGGRLPTEAEWEKAARGGLEQALFAWGDELTPHGKHRCNIWQGKFPIENTLADGYLGTAPVKSYRANGFGLYAVAGNVWEWCSDWFTAETHPRRSGRNPVGPESGDRRVMKGGSYLCHYSYCNRYRVAARTSNTPDTSVGNLGFRLAMTD